MAVTKNKIYTKIRNDLVAYDSNVFVTSERVYTTSRFPTVQIRRIQHEQIRDDVNLSADVVYKDTWEVQAFSDSTSGGFTQAEKLIEVTEQTFRNLGYRMVSSFPTENEKEITIKRHIARFTKVVCSGDEA